MIHICQDPLPSRAGSPDNVELAMELEGLQGWPPLSRRAQLSASCATIVIDIPVCPLPQNSAQTPAYRPGLSARITILFTTPGIASTLPPSRGTQKLWITSTLLTLTSTLRPAGISSVSTTVREPVTVWRENRHCQRSACASTVIAGGPPGPRILSPKTTP